MIKNNVQKGIAWLLASLLAVSLTACGGGSPAPKGELTTDVTLEELLAANELPAVFDQVESLSSVITDEEGQTYFHYAAMVDGQLMYSQGTEGKTTDFVNGIKYTASADGLSKYMIVMAPDTDPFVLLDEMYGMQLTEFDLTGEVYSSEGEYFISLYAEDEEWGMKEEGYAYFDTETLLLDRVDTTTVWGPLKSRNLYELTYNIPLDFATPSYDSITKAENAVDVTIHYPDGSTTDITTDRDASISAHHPDHSEGWSVCWDEACTESVDNFGWIEGDHGDVYLCEGQRPAAPPALRRVLEKSTFDAMFRENYNSYFQTTYQYNPNEELIGVEDMKWYTVENGVNLAFEILDGDYNVHQSSLAQDNALYSWAEETGYIVDFYDDLSYAEVQVEEYREYLHEEQLGAPMVRDEETGIYYIPYEETENDMVKEYEYWIHPDFHFIEHAEITQKDNAGTIIGHESIYFSGNGPTGTEKDVFMEVTEPSDADTVDLTVVSPIGEKTYKIRTDASISWKGGAIYSDEACTTAVTDLSWVNGGSATVYAK